MCLEFTNEDLLLLEKQRLDRFQSCFADTLPFCFLLLDNANTLTIHCSEAWLVDQILHEMDDLRAAAWVIVGAFQIAIYFAQEEIYTTTTQLPSAACCPVNPAQISW